MPLEHIMSEIQSAISGRPHCSSSIVAKKMKDIDLEALSKLLVMIEEMRYSNRFSQGP